MARPSQKTHILAEASKLFSQKGYHATTIREIAERRGILPGSLYAYISSKEDLLFEVVDEGADAFLKAITDVANSTADPVDKLRDGLAAHIQVIATHLDEATVFLHEWKALSAPRRAKIQAKRDEYEQIWDGIIQEGVNHGVFQVTDPKYSRLLILSVGNWAYHWYQPTGPKTPTTLADEFIKIVVRGLIPCTEELANHA